MKKSLSQDDYIYYSLIIAIIILIVFYLTFGKYISVPECYIYKNYNIFCPGCGCTRAFLAMIRGDFLESIKQNSAVLFTSIITIIYLISQTISRITKIEKIRMKYSIIYLYLGIGLIIFNCILKNVIIIF